MNACAGRGREGARAEGERRQEVGEGEGEGEIPRPLGCSASRTSAHLAVCAVCAVCAGRTASGVSHMAAHTWPLRDARRLQSGRCSVRRLWS